MLIVKLCLNSNRRWDETGETGCDGPSDPYTYVVNMVEDQVLKDEVAGNEMAKLSKRKIANEVVKQTVSIVPCVLVNQMGRDKMMMISWCRLWRLCLALRSSVPATRFRNK